MKVDKAHICNQIQLKIDLGSFVVHKDRFTISDNAIEMEDTQALLKISLRKHLASDIAYYLYIKVSH